MAQVDEGYGFTQLLLTHRCHKHASRSRHFGNVLKARVRVHAADRFMRIESNVIKMKKKIIDYYCSAFNINVL